MIEVQNKLSVYIQNIHSHKYIKEDLLKLIFECPSDSLDSVSNTDWDEDRDTRSYYWNYFSSIVEPYIHLLGMKLGYERYTIVNYWFQQYEKNSEHKWHIHYDNNDCNEKADGYGGIYFLELPEKLGTEFFNYPVLDYKEGDLVIFPSYLPHRSPINITNQRKTSIVFNYVYKL